MRESARLAAPGRAWGLVVSGNGSGTGLGRRGETDGDGCACVHYAVDVDAPTMHVRNLFDDGQPQPDAGNALYRGKYAIEAVRHAGQIVIGNAHAAILYGEK